MGMEPLEGYECCLDAGWEVWDGGAVEGGDECSCAETPAVDVSLWEPSERLCYGCLSVCCGCLSICCGCLSSYSHCPIPRRGRLRMPDASRWEGWMCCLPRCVAAQPVGCVDFPRVVSWLQHARCILGAKGLGGPEEVREPDTAVAEGKRGDVGCWLEAGAAGVGVGASLDVAVDDLAEGVEDGWLGGKEPPPPPPPPAAQP